MIYSNFFEHEAQSTKWNRMRVDYDLVERIIRAKEALADQEADEKKCKLKIQTTIK